MNKRTFDKLEQFRDELARNSTQAGLTSFADSRYNDLYRDKQQIRAPSREDAWRLVQQFLKAIIRKPGYSTPGIGRAHYFEQRHADRFFEELQQSFKTANLPLTCEQCAPTSKAHKHGWCAGETLVRCWTSNLQCQPLDREWCSLLQAGVRLNDPDLTPIIVQIWASMNVYCVNNREKSSGVPRNIPWPSNRVLHRGGRLHEEAMQWWDTACETLEVFRVPGAVPVSKHQSTAFDFMNNYSQPDSAPKAYFRFHLITDTNPCDHAVCLDLVSVLPEEQEFLFPPFSGFQAISKTWHQEEGGYFVIFIKVLKNNQASAVPKEVPLCPWI